jgi:hypothetical protein
LRVIALAHVSLDIDRMRVRAAALHPNSTVNFDDQPKIRKTEIRAISLAFIFSIARIRKRELRRDARKFVRLTLKCKFSLELLLVEFRL